MSHYNPSPLCVCGHRQAKHNKPKPGRSAVNCTRCLACNHFRSAAPSDASTSPAPASSTGTKGDSR